MTLAALFLSAFLAATLLPAQSELTLGAVLASESVPIWAAIVCATLGNTLGSAVNWLLGRYCIRFQEKRWFPVSAASLAKAERWYAKYGRWSLLLSWAPIIGDPLTLAAGLLKEPFPSFLGIVFFAKGVRYLAVAAVTLHFI